MKYDQSFGILPLRQGKEGWEILLIQHCAGHWAFPKGHPEHGETEHQTAERELTEETGLIVSRYLSVGVFQEKYTFIHQNEKIFKTVTYYPAIVNGVVVIQIKEIKNYDWLPLAGAQEKITFKEGKNICKQLHSALNSLKC